MCFSAKSALEAKTTKATLGIVKFGQKSRVVDLVDESDLESKLAFEQGVLKEYGLPHGNSGRRYLQNKKKKQDLLQEQTEKNSALFKGCVFWVDGLALTEDGRADSTALHEILVKNGGRVCLTLFKEVNVVIAEALAHSKIEKLLATKARKTRNYVTHKWVFESLKLGKLAPYDKFRIKELTPAENSVFGDSTAWPCRNQRWSRKRAKDLTRRS